MAIADTPTIEYRTILNDSGDPGYVNRLLIATPVTGLVRIEWVQARYGQVIPVNWSMVQMLQYMNAYYPLRYQVADAQNLIAQAAIDGEFEWLLLIEHDTCPPPDAFIRINKYIRDCSHPVVSGLYYTRSRPSEPLVFRGDGTSFFDQWEMGQKVSVDRVPTGFLLVHVGLLKSVWAESEEYLIGDQKARRVFNTPRDIWFDPETNQYNTMVGTSDMAWSRRVIEDAHLEKSGWHIYADEKYPFIVDTEIFCRHINNDGEVFP
jgi:hypothetical protein